VQADTTNYFVVWWVLFKYSSFDHFPNYKLHFQADSAVKYDSRILYVKWRGLLDRRLHSGYFKHKAYYKLNVLEDKLDNM